jgi:hypothetical protein
MNLVKTIKSLQRDVSRYKSNNEGVMKSKEKKNGINIKLLQFFDRIEKKVDKRIDSSKSKKHIYHDKGGESKSVGIYCHHSIRCLVKREEISSSPSSVRNNSTSSGVDELQGEMNNIKPHTFDGEHKKDEDVETWLLGMRKYF